MSRRRIVRAIALTILCLAASGGVSAQVYLDSRSTDFNPALGATSRRSILEIGTRANVAAYNSAFAIGEILSPTWVIDFNRIAESSGRSGLRIGTEANAAADTTLRLFGVGIGAYARVDALALLTIPTDLLELVAAGNIEDYTGTSGALIRASAEAGSVVTAEVGRWTFGLGVGMSVPLAYSGDGGLTYALATTETGFSASAALDMQVYSAIDLAAVQAGTMPDIMGAIGNGAFKIDLGVIRRDGDLPRWGVALNDLTIIRGSAPYTVGVTGSYSASMENVLQGLIDGAETFPVEFTAENVQLTTVGGEEHRIFLAPGITGFYRFSLPFVDITPQAEVIIGQGLTAVNPGVILTGNRFPTDKLYLGFGYTRPLWRAVAGLRIPLYVMELNVQMESSAPRLGGIFSLAGVTAAVDLRLGF